MFSFMREGELVVRAAHRVSYFLEWRIDPGESCVCHECDNPPCVRPNHLFLGDQRDNIRDMRSKGRFNNAGESSWNSVLKDCQVMDIKRMLRDGVMQTEIAKRYSVSQQTISAIKAGRTWRHIVIPKN